MKATRYALFVLAFISSLIFLSDRFWPCKVFDCFPFCHELEVLKIRLDELKDVVDYFVIVESIETQRGHPKPLHFENHKELFKPYWDKIIHVAIRDPHPEMEPWTREHFQRNCIAQGLKNKASSRDIILISDVDEIPRKQAIAAVRRKLRQGEKGVRLHQEMYYYKLNLQMPTKKTIGGEDWFGTVATLYRRVVRQSPQYFRDRRNFEKWPPIWNGGWHFSSAGPNDAIRTKLFSVVEGGDQMPTDEEFEAHFKALYHAPIDHSFPEYIQRNAERLKKEGFIRT